MKYWEQDKTEPDCGPCCVAMLAGVTRTQALQAFHARNDDGTTGLGHVRSVLDGFGCTMSGLKKKNRTRQDFLRRGVDCLLRTKSDGAGNWHWMVWDARAGRVLDPMRPDRKRFPGNLRGFYEIRRK